MGVTALVEDLKAANEDFEFYPTTSEMLAAVRTDMLEIYDTGCDETKYPRCSVLDIGAGTGSALEALTVGKKFAIEKSQRLIKEMDKGIYVVGSDFESNTLIDKSANVIFSNPPYSLFTQWAEKIILEANAEYIYLVIPQRWKNSDVISDAIKARKAISNVIYSGDFLEADRRARAKVDIVKIDLKSGRKSYRHYDDNNMSVDPFSLWFSKHFKVSTHETKQEEFQRKASMAERMKAQVSHSNELIKNEGLVKTLELLYHREMKQIMDTYLMLNRVDADLLKELNVSIENVQEGLKNKIASLKNLYWQELFDNMGVILDKLTTNSRQQMLEELFNQTSVDFNAQNAYSILIWAIKNANSYFDDQLIDLFDTMTGHANITLYRSNERTFGKEEWRYSRTPDGLDRYKLDLRIVVSKVGGIKVDTWGRSPACGLESRCLNFLNDIITVASNLGYDISKVERPDSLHWASNVKHEFFYHNHTTGKQELLFDCRAFQNGNVHLRFAQSFICDLNIENGRLRGWIKNGYEAADELDISPEIALPAFTKNLQITDKSVPLLLAS
ncbi:hypothetical protein VroAM7_48960 (plasmid) [Vibrio rotiferianus]|uniref:DUF4942 domain-containing protein n=1 Tax=Vibrio rotiferianus TaxID=190895 RepID=A0A510IEU5_9VIBR|nr:DUF4942 domain-containing protein [Vibrio rotiferianus]BBL92243.1 hypothetical protein VroAM7_48960 [Vibrio rotiferianus]